MNVASDRRNGPRRMMDMPITKQMGDSEKDAWTADVSPTGIKIRKHGAPAPTQRLCNLELHLVPGAITTVIAARRVWTNNDYEAYEFVDPSFAQQIMLERMVGTI